jgi:tripartite-type tricarboxylate transporter receptor subunit TctC
MRASSLLWIALVLFSAALQGRALAQDFPTKQITLTVPLAAGGGMDFIARTIGQKLSERLGVPVLIENRPGGGTIVATVAEAKAAPDGYALLLVPGSTLTTNATVYKNLPYDLRKDFVPIAVTSEVAFALVVNPSLPVHSIAELVKYAKERPGELIVGTSGIATTTHLAGEILANRTGIKLRYAHYRGSPPALNDVIAGNVQMMFADPVTGAQLAKAGKVRALAVTSKRSISIFPGLPPIADTVPGYEATNWHMLIAPAHTPDAVVDKLGKEVRAVTALPDVHANILKVGLLPRESPPQGEMRAFLDNEIATWGKLIHEIGLAGSM